MNRTWFASILLAVLLGIGILVSFLIGNIAKETESLLKKSVSYVELGDFSSAESHCRKTLDYWMEHHGIMAAFLRHDEPDAVETGLAQLISYARTQDNDEFLAVFEEVRYHLNHIREMELPKMQNIL